MNGDFLFKKIGTILLLILPVVLFFVGISFLVFPGIAYYDAHSKKDWNHSPAKIIAKVEYRDHNALINFTKVLRLKDKKMLKVKRHPQDFSFGVHFFNKILYNNQRNKRNVGAIAKVFSSFEDDEHHFDVRPNVKMLLLQLLVGLGALLGSKFAFGLTEKLPSRPE